MTGDIYYFNNNLIIDIGDSTLFPFPPVGNIMHQLLYSIDHRLLHYLFRTLTNFKARTITKWDIVQDSPIAISMRG